MNELAEDYFRRGYAAQREGRLDEAIELYGKSIELEPSAEAHTYMGWALSFQRRHAEAIEACRRAIEVDPDFGNPYNDIGAYLIEMGRWDDAIPWFEKAVAAPRYEPRHFPYFNLARVHVHRFEYDRAVKCLEKAVELEPNYAPAQREIKRLLARMN
jgi:tetratricopeptide (TPR) repeat protein